MRFGGRGGQMFRKINIERGTSLAGKAELASRGPEEAGTAVSIPRNQRGGGRGRRRGPGARAGGAGNLERIPGRAAAAAARAGARVSERGSGRASAPGIGSGGVEAGRLRLPDASATRSIQAPGASERAGGREEEGEAEPLSPSRGAGRDPASAAPGRPDRGRGGPRSPGHLVRPRGRARSQPGKTKQTRTQLSPPPRPRPPFGAPRTFQRRRHRLGLGRARASRVAAVVHRASGAVEAERGLFPAWGGPAPPPPMMAPPGSSREPTCHLLSPRAPPARLGLGRSAPCVFVGSPAGTPRPLAPSLAPIPARGRPSAATLPPPPVSLSLPAAGPEPSARPAGPIVSRAGRATPAGVGGRPRALSFPRSGARARGHPVPCVPPASGRAPSSAPASLLRVEVKESSHLNSL